MLTFKIAKYDHLFLFFYNILTHNLIMPVRRSSRIKAKAKRGKPARASRAATGTDMGYLSILINPFSTSTMAPKLLDGKVPRTSGVRLRSTGELSCNTAGPSMIALIPGLSNSICWNLDGATVVAPSAFGGHVGTVSDRANVQKGRIVSAGLRLSLINNADQNDGYWEAARIPIGSSDFTINSTTGLATFGFISDETRNLSQYQTYQTGKIRDIHRIQFDLSSQDTEHDYNSLVASAGGEMIDIKYDVVVIKINGRTGVGTDPTKLMYDTISNQELVYKEDTALARLMTKTKRSTMYNMMLQKQVKELPAYSLA